MVSSVETTLIATDNDNECETKENKNLLAKFSIKTTTATGFGNYGHSKALVQPDLLEYHRGVHHNRLKIRAKNNKKTWE